MNYVEAVEYMDQLNTKGIKPGLESVGALLDAFDNPEKDLPVIHIAGTNGKGSTARYIYETLISSGYKVGLYSSPAVYEDREIISVNGKNISKNSYAKITEKASNTGLSFTRFELETAMAFSYFKEKKCDIAIIECGMGGTLDATNVCKNTVVAIFSMIGMDHMAFLGNTVEEIAKSKSGIIKPGATVVISGENDDNVIGVLSEEAKKYNCAVRVSDRSLVKSLRTRTSGTSFNYKEVKDCKLSNLGINQVDNAINALEAVFALKSQGFLIKEDAILKGFYKAKQFGRFDIIMKNPVVVLDGAHNEPASRILRENICTYFEGKKLIFIMCVLKDKEYDKVIRNTCDLAWQVITVTSPNRQRALPAYDLAKAISEVNQNVTAVDSVEEVVELSLMLSDKDTVIVSFGSLSHLARVNEVVAHRKEIKKDWHRIND